MESHYLLDVKFLQTLQLMKNQTKLENCWCNKVYFCPTKFWCSSIHAKCNFFTAHSFLELVAGSWIRSPWNFFYFIVERLIEQESSLKIGSVDEREISQCYFLKSSEHNVSSVQQKEEIFSTFAKTILPWKILWKSKNLLISNSNLVMGYSKYGLCSSETWCLTDLLLSFPP